MEHSIKDVLMLEDIKEKVKVGDKIK